MKLRSSCLPIPLLWLLCLLNNSHNALAQTVTASPISRIPTRTDPYACAQYPDCLTCLASFTCGWAEGKDCVSGCPGGKGCVTPRYGGNTNQATICALPQAQLTFPTNAACSQYNNCYDCLRNKQCGFENGATCSASCTGKTCVQSNFGGLAISALSASRICTLPPAFPTTLVNVPERACSFYTSCTLCIGSKHCAWQTGNTCVENCQGGKPCVTPNYGQLQDTNPDFSTGMTAICNLPEGTGGTISLMRQAGTIAAPDKTPVRPSKSPALRKKKKSKNGGFNDPYVSENP